MGDRDHLRKAKKPGHNKPAKPVEHATYVAPDGYMGKFGPVGPIQFVKFEGEALTPPPGYIPIMCPLGLCWPQRQEFQIVSPAQADAILAFHNEGNRSFKPAQIIRICKDLGLGKWMLNGEPLIFGWNGRLLNGQNRLSACMKTEIPLPTSVIFGINPEAFKTMDQIVKRDLGDILTDKGVKNAKLAAATLRTIWQYGRKGVRSTAVFHCAEINTVLLDFHDVLKGLDASVTMGKGIGKNLSLPDRVLAATHYLLGMVNPVARSSFFKGLESGANLSEGHPILTLTKRIARHQADMAKEKQSKKKSGYSATGDHLAYALMYGLIRAWNAVFEKQKLVSFKLPEPSDAGGYTMGLPDISGWHMPPEWLDIREPGDDD